MKQFIATAALMSFISASTLASAGPIFTCDISTKWLSLPCERAANVATHGSLDLYVMGYGYHFNRAEPESKHPLNAKSYGGGIGKHWTDGNGNEDLLFSFVFLDSHDHVEPVVGYARQWFTPSVLGGLAIGGGFAAVITARSDVLHYTPVPVVLPVASLRLNKASLMATFFPRIGNVATSSVVLVWARYEF